MTEPTPRQCFAVFESQRNERGFIPSLVTENEPGHSPLIGRGELSEPWYWGQTIEEARKVCDRANLERGITPTAAAEIVASSIAASIRTDAAAAERRRRLDELGLKQSGGYR